MEAIQTVKKPEDVLRELNSDKNTSIVRIQLGNFQRTRRVCAAPYVSNYKGNAVCTVPYGEDNWEFSFSLRKAQALQAMMRDGSFDDLVAEAVRVQEKADAMKPRVCVGILEI